jgi:hypothetical protein
MNNYNFLMADIYSNDFLVYSDSKFSFFKLLERERITKKDLISKNLAICMGCLFFVVITKRH